MDFLNQYQQLIKTSPKIFTHSLKNENAEYTDYIYRSKNVYFAFDGGGLSDSVYLFNSSWSTDCFDVSNCLKCELCFEGVDCDNCYNCSYCQDCSHSTNLQFCYRCRHCSDLFGCAGLSFKQYCIFNQQLTKEEYEKQRVEFIKLPPDFNLAKLQDLVKTLPKPFNRNLGSENCDFANSVYKSKNLYWCFDLADCQDCLYSDDIEFSRDCVDCINCHECELCYECNDVGHSFSCGYLSGCDHLTCCHFCTHCYKSEYLFGCVNLSHAKHCILNKQYSEDEYLKKVKEIKNELGWSDTGFQTKPSKRGWWMEGGKKNE